MSATFGEAAVLPAEVRQELERQRAAMRTLFVEVENHTVRNGRQITYTSTACFEGDRIRTKAPSDVSFDGEMLWLVSTQRDGSFAIQKTQIRNTTETTPTFNEFCWRLPYFEAAGIYFPPYVKDVRTFDSLKPLVLHFLENEELAEVAQDGEHLRVRFSVKDWVLLNAREIDPVLFRKQIEGMPSLDAAAKSNQVAKLEAMRAMVPTRTVSMLLDLKHGYAPMEREDRTVNGQLIARYSVDEWKYFSNATTWLPAKSRVSYFTMPYWFDEFPQTPVQSIQMNLKNAEFTPRKTEFVVLKEPRYRVAGTEVHDETISNVVDGVRQAVILTMAADGTLS